MGSLLAFPSKCFTRADVTDSEKHSSLFQNVFYYGRKMFNRKDSFFNFKLGCFCNECNLKALPHLELKTLPKFCPVSLSLSMVRFLETSCSMLACWIASRGRTLTLSLGKTL
jgi:hypothetical protein